MVYLYEPFGGLSNNLFQHIHLDAFCRENQLVFTNPFINHYLPSQKKMQETATFKLRKLLTGLHLCKLIEFNEPEDCKKDVLLKNYSAVFVKGWAYRNKSLTLRDRRYYSDLFFGGFVPKENPIDKTVANIAVHIRRGDYLHWQNGIYYFKDDIYIKAIAHLMQLLNRSCKVIVFTNDTDLNKELYRSHFENIYFSANDEKTDHYLMSRCDYILGPPSTFSMWASYVGNTKFYHIKNVETNFTLENFEICEG